MKFIVDNTIQESCDENLVFGVSVSFAFLCLVVLVWTDEFHPNRKWRSRDEAVLEACLPCVSFGYNICCLGGIWEWYYIFEKVMLRAVGSSVACLSGSVAFTARNSDSTSTALKLSVFLSGMTSFYLAKESN